MVPLGSHFLFMLRWKQIIVIAACLLLFAPYLFTCFYALPFADDFCFGWTASQNSTFLQKFLNQYLFWNGRYSADVLANLHPMLSGRLITAQVIFAACIIAMPLLLTLLFRRVTKNTGLSTSAALLATLYYYNQLPNVSEGLYWYIGISNYLLGDLVLLLHFLFAFRNNIAAKATALLCLILAVGFNEVGALLIPLFYLAGIFIASSNFRERRKEVILYFSVATVCSALVFFSPGNFTRSKEFENSFQLLHSLLYSAMQTGRFIASWMLSVPFIALSLLVYVHAIDLRKNFTDRIPFVFPILFLLFIVFAAAFLPYMATGILGQHRTMNYVFFYFILLWLMALVNAGNTLPAPASLAALKKPLFSSVLLGAALLSLAVRGNGFELSKDLQNGSMAAYKAEFFQRQLNIAGGKTTVIPALYRRPASLSIVDARADTAYWIDKCMKNYYTQGGRPLH